MDLFMLLLSCAGLGLVFLSLAVLLRQYTEFRNGRLDRVLFGIRWGRLAVLFFLLLGILGAEFLGTVLGIEAFALANVVTGIISVLMILGLIILVQNMMDKDEKEVY
jgi:hypothetical protein